MSKKQRIRFTGNETLMVLREVLFENPYEDNNKWNIITEKMIIATHKNFTLRGIKDHVEYELKIWNKENNNNLKKSGIAEDYDEKQQLLQSIKDLQREFVSKNESRKLGSTARHRAATNINYINSIESVSSEACSSELCQDDYSTSLYETPEVEVSYQEEDTHSTNISPISDAMPYNSSSENSLTLSSPLQNIVSTPTNRMSHRNKSQNPLCMLQERCKQEKIFQQESLNIKREKLKLEEKKLEFEQRKLEIEKEERMTRLELEVKERCNNIEMAKQQKNMMEILLHLVTNKSNNSS